MKKTAKILTLLLVAGSILSACKKKDNEVTAFASAGVNSSTGAIDVGSISRSITASGFSNNVHDVKVRFQGSHALLGEAELFLRSPSGKILELMTDPTDASSSLIDVTFSDAGSVSADVWSSGTGSTANFTGTFKPAGTLNSGYTYTGTITTFAGFKGDTPNGTWTLYMSDDVGGDYFNITSWELSLSTSK